MRLLAGMSIILILACTDRPVTDPSSAILTSYEARFPCSPNIKIVPFPWARDDSLTAGQRCALVSASLAAFDTQAAPRGLSAADTAAVITAAVFAMDALDPATDSVLAAHWYVHLELKGRPYDAEAVVDRQTGELQLWRTHKMQ